MAKKKEEKKAAPVKGDEASDIVMKYLRKQNRPYSAVDVFNNLSGAVGKTNVVKALTTMVEEQQIHGKLFGKQWVYVAKQDEFEVPSKEELDSMDVKIAELKERVFIARDEIKQAQAELSTISSSLTTDQIEAKLKAVEAENESYESRLSTLRSGAAVSNMSVEDRAKLDRDLDTMRKHWRIRKRMFNEMWGTVTESIQGNLAEFRETVGIETDEMVGLNINDDPLKM
ncbi:Tat binding protein 1-interacting protein [Fimicolochytrium jonesii]|uniref:Tat binding protein 1-interacting protein n=1 Tax=Fimicolochytrium jonesii TaxID=1396493 RepID=UPI0022FF2F32|nr:Tat binding protein 1-interacting protein [Fimicolochytrium jonesii]KAI8818713.1 Tat binding protein 1-interacting protein [Fimicolochytrium jonesii]